MTVEKIKILLEKYFEGETSLEEEMLLSEYFNSSEVASELKQYQSLFQFFKIEKFVQLPETAVIKAGNTSPQSSTLSFIKGSLWWRAAAAVLILGVSTFLINKQFNQTVKNKNCVAENCRVKVFDENEDPEKAFEEVQAALKLVSKKMKKGTDETAHGMEKVKHATDEVEKFLPKDE